MNNSSANTQKKLHLNKVLRRFLHILSNLSRSFLASILGIILNYILVRYKANGVLTTYVYSISIINLLFVFTNWGGKNYLTKTYAKEPSAAKELTAKLLGSKLLFSLLIIPVLFFLPLDGWVKLIVAAYLILKTVGQIFEALIVIRKKYQYSLVIDSLLGIALLVVIYTDGNTDNPILFLIELLIAELFRNLVYAFLFSTEMAITLRMDTFLEVVKNSAMFFFISLAGFLCSRADLYAIGFFLGKESMGTYFILTNLVSLSMIAYTAINSTFEAGIIRYNQKSFLKFVQLSIYTGFVFSLVSTMAVYTICTFYFTINLSYWFYALIVVNVYGFTRVLMHMYHYTRSENPRVVLRCLLISGLTNILLSCLFTNYMGPIGAFAANTIAVYVNLLLLKKENKGLMKKTI